LPARAVFAQEQAFSVATDFAVLRSLTPGQIFTAVGQTVQGNFYFNKRDGAYVSLNYFTNGRYSNPLTATAKDSSVSPQTINYTSRSVLRYRQVSLGLKHYFKGSYNNEESWNLYGTAGFGILMGKVENAYNVTIDTADYNVPQRALEGLGGYKRLTFDVGLGGEVLIGAGIYLYSDVRTWIPASDYPSPYLYNNNSPRVVVLSGGIRILID
jgi:hypothetical protein